MSVGGVKIESSLHGSTCGCKCWSWSWHPVSARGLVTKDVVIVSGCAETSLGCDKYFWRPFWDDARAVSWDIWWWKSGAFASPCALLLFSNGVAFKEQPVLFLHTSVARTMLLLWGAAFFVPLGLEQEDPLWSPLLPVCVQMCAAFLVLVYSGSQLMVQHRNHWTGVRVSNQESLLCHSLAMWPWAIQLPSWGLFHYHEMRIIMCSSLCNCEDEMNETAGGKLTLYGFHIDLLWIFQFSTAA